MPELVVRDVSVVLARKVSQKGYREVSIEVNTPTILVARVCKPATAAIAIKLTSRAYSTRS
jgi:hypothetical protein